MNETCHVCQFPVSPGQDGMVQREGITEPDRGKQWVWGPVIVHDHCRMKLATPYDNRGGFQATGDRVTPG